MLNCAHEEWGRLTPTCAYAQRVKPEQSKPVRGEVPPQWYGTPRCLSATLTTRAALADIVDAFALPVWASPKTNRNSRPVRVRERRMDLASSPAPAPTRRRAATTSHVFNVCEGGL